MKNPKKNELKFKKLNVSNLQNIVGGNMEFLSADYHTDACNSSSESCSSMNTRFTRIVSCCGSCSPSNQKC